MMEDQGFLSIYTPVLKFLTSKMMVARDIILHNTQLLLHNYRLHAYCKTDL